MDLDAFYRLVAELRGHGYSEPEAYRRAEAMMEEEMESQTLTGDHR